ncbi:MAG: VapC toxin family PIN domain ribonuclease [Deltaproteobacteria bacterium CG_4_9_14_3_um_filter_63_12]|nr:MAG: VapC toxin family PIN domain ribonuclease [Deltaproteobacteria bacterium CG_4_9_14_3_um_filter_63_12]
MRALFDVNVLVALLDADHHHHEHASRWLREHGADGWASGPITQNGCVRVMSQPSYPNPIPPHAVIWRLREATRHPKHEFWPDVVSLLDTDTIDEQRLHGPRQVTDLYLLAMAAKHEGTFVTFDHAIPLSAVRGARDAHLTLL